VKQKTTSLILAILLTVGSAAAVPLHEQCRDYFNFKDYDKALELANRALISPEYKNKTEIQEEMLYIINECGDEIAELMQKSISLTNADNYRLRAADYRKRFKIAIDIEPDGFYYAVNYRHEALNTLLKLNPRSPWIEIIKLKSLLRLSRYSLDPVYRFNEDRRTLNLFVSYISNYPGSQFKPNLILKAADLYFSLFEQAGLLKNQLNLSEPEINALYERSKDLYKFVLRNYPDSQVSRYIGEIRMDNVKLRKDPNTKSSIIKVIRIGTLVRVTDRSDLKTGIGNMYDFWYKVRLGDGAEGWIYGVYLNTSFTGR
jgi:tetratricopeptide (TPR) repeat protein